MNVNNGVKVDCRVSQSTAVCTRSWHVEGGPHGRKGHSLCDGQHGREFSCTWGRWIFLVGCPFELRGDLVLMKGDIQSLFLFPGQCKRVREQTGKASCILEGHLSFMGVPSPGNICFPSSHPQLFIFIQRKISSEEEAVMAEVYRYRDHHR